jgi:membrane-bound lytic murein transglycosylase D
MVRPITLFTIILSTLAQAQVEPGNLTIGSEDPVLQRLDDLAALPWVTNDPFTSDTALLNLGRFAPTDTPSYPEAVLRERLAKLDAQTPFALVYNGPVQGYIDLYSRRRREQCGRMLGLTQLYFPMFEEALDRHGLPLELKYLAVVESALNPIAGSRVGAKGLWQFMLPTGKLYGLDVTSYVDERFDPLLSTDAACRYLKQLHSIYNNWELALAAYNCGPGNVNKAIRRSGGRTGYWEIYDHLPRETRGYVPAFIAVNYIMNHAADHNLYPLNPAYCAYETDTVHVGFATTLAAVAQATGSTEEELITLNPMFKTGVLPEPRSPWALTLPRSAVAAYLAHEQDLRSAPQAPVAVAVAEAPAPSAAAKRMHTVRRGESLGLIAKKYHASVGDLRTWNKLRGDRIQPGQRLVVGYSKAQASATAAAPVPQKVTAQVEKDTAATPVAIPKEYIYHTVQKGDTLWDIAQRYPGATVDGIRRLNSGLKSTNLVPGKKIKVGLQGS